MSIFLHAFMHISKFLISPQTNSRLLWDLRNGSIFVLNPVDKLSKTLTNLTPLFSKYSTIFDPINPAPPVTNIDKSFISIVYSIIIKYFNINYNYKHKYILISL